MAEKPAGNDETKFRKCRHCGNDCEIGKPCACGWYEEKAVARVTQRRLERQIETEIEEREKKGKGGKPGDKPGSFFEW